MSALDGASSVAITLAYLWSLALIIFTDVGKISYRSDSELFAIKLAAFENGALFFDVACVMTFFLLAGRIFVRRSRASLPVELSQYKPVPNSTVTVVKKLRKPKSSPTPMARSPHSWAHPPAHQPPYP